MNKRATIQMLLQQHFDDYASSPAYLGAKSLSACASPLPGAGRGTDRAQGMACGPQYLPVPGAGIIKAFPG